MTCEIIGIQGAVLEVRISGVMKLADQLVLQDAGRKLIEKGVKARLLVTLDNFQGWEKGADWGDIGFLMAYGKDISKIAIVGDEQWKDQAFAFVGKGLRSSEIEFFPASSLKKADTWIRL